MTFKFNPFTKKLDITGSGSLPSGDIITLSAEGGAATAPTAGGNYNFSGSTAGGSAANGAILFITPGGAGAATPGQMDARVLVDGSTVTINGSNQLTATPPVSYANQYTADDATIAIPTSHNLNVLSRDNRDNNVNGIQTTADPNGSANLYVELTNRVRGNVTTTDATPTTIITDVLSATPGVYEITGSVIGYNTTDTLGVSFAVTSGVRSTGAASIEIGTEITSNFKEVGMVNTNVTITVSGNDILVNVIGLAGKTINWDALFTYRFVS